MRNQMNEKTIDSASPPSQSELSSIKNMINSFLLALRIYNLYPEDHSICQKSLTTLQGHLDEYLTSHETLRLDVGKDTLLFKGEVIYLGLSQEDSLSFLLYRNGVLWIEFLGGISKNELNTFLKLLNQYRLLKEEDEGNLATSLWDSNLLHLKYEARDILWKDEVLIELTYLKPARESSNKSDDVGGTASFTSTNIDIPKVDSTLWRLTPTEEIKLRNMVYEEEKHDYKNYIHDVIIIALKEQRDLKNRGGLGSLDNLQ